MKPYTIACGRLYDPKTDTSTNFIACDNWARWNLVPSDGIHRYACASHLNQVLGELVGKQMMDLTVQDLRG